MADIEFDLLTQLLSSFKDTVDGMTVEQKRAAIRTFVKEIVWDGTHAHMVLFGSEYAYEFPEADANMGYSAISCKNTENFEKSAETGDIDPLRAHSK